MLTEEVDAHTRTLFLERVAGPVVRFCRCFESRLSLLCVLLILVGLTMAMVRSEAEAGTKAEADLICRCDSNLGGCNNHEVRRMVKKKQFYFSYK